MIYRSLRLRLPMDSVSLRSSSILPALFLFLWLEVDPALGLLGLPMVPDIC